MVAEEMVVSLSGGGPWGFRLQGGADQQKPLQVAKVRKRSKACRAGLKEHDELVAIGDHKCSELSHAQAMSLIDTQSAALTLRVKRASGFHSSICSPARVPSPPATPMHSHRSSILSPTGLARDITSPPDSEAYYGETDSDADTQAHTHRRQRRTPPHARSPARYGNQDEEETSEMSGYESATDAGVSLQGQWDGQSCVGVPRRELLYQPLQSEWSTPARPPHTPTPHTLALTPDQGLVEAEGEGDSGFQEAGGGIGLTCPPLVSPERAKEALMLGSSRQLVPMVGPQQTPVSDELSSTYMDKARQAKLQRGESVVERQVKEARSKCRSIASLLTDAPNPNSKGVLMFKKRRQRAKKYTLTCFGKADGDKGEETEGETGGETEEEGGSSIPSGSEIDEEGFSASFDATWDSGYLDLLDRRSSACPSNTPTSAAKPAAHQSPGLDIAAYQTAGLLPPGNPSLALEASGPENSSHQDSGLEGSRRAPMSPPAVALTNGRSTAVSRASVVLSPPSQNGSSHPSGDGSSAAPNPDLLLPNPSPNAGVLNRTARPFIPVASPSRATVTSVMFRPPQPKPAVAALPVAAVSVMTIAPAHHPPDARRAVSSTSLYIPPRNSNSHPPPSAPTPPSALSPPSSLCSAPLSHPPANPQTLISPPTMHLATSGPFSPPVCPSFAQPFSPVAPQPPPPTPTCAPSFNCISPASPPFPSNLTQVSFHSQPTPQPTVPTGMTGAVAPGVSATMATASPPHAPAGDSLVAREKRISVPAARTGILHDARRRSNKKPMFCSVQNREVSPNPDLLLMLQNMDDRCGRTPVAPSAEAGHESGPEEDWLRLGAEACNFMQAQRGCRPPPVAPKPQAPPVPQLAGKGGQLFARRQNRMDRYVVERSPSVAAAPYSPAQTREPSPTPSLPATWKYSPNIRAPPPISYNPLLSPSCPPKAQKKPEVAKPGPARPKGQKAAGKPVDIMNHKPYQLNSSLFSYGGGLPLDAPTSQQQRGTSSGPPKTARVYEVRRFSTPPPVATGPTLKVIVPRSATTLGEPLWRSDVASPPPTAPYQPFQPQWGPSQLPQQTPPAPTAPLPQLPSFSSPLSPAQPSNPTQATRQFKSAPDLSPLDAAGASRPAPGSGPPTRVPRPRFSTSNWGLQPCVWRPGSTTH